MKLSGRFRLLIDKGLGQFGQSLISLLLFREGGVQKLDGLVHPKFALTQMPSAGMPSAHG